MLTTYELGQEIARIQIHIAENSKISTEKATNVAHILGIEGDQRIEFMEGYQNKFTEIMRKCDLCGGGEGEEMHNCAIQPEETPGWLPNAAELDEIEENLPAEEAQETNGAFYL